MTALANGKVQEVRIVALTEMFILLFATGMIAIASLFLTRHEPLLQSWTPTS